MVTLKRKRSISFFLFLLLMWSLMVPSAFADNLTATGGGAGSGTTSPPVPTASIAVKVLKNGQEVNQQNPLQANDHFSLVIMGSNISRLYGYSIDFKYDPQLLEPVEQWFTTNGSQVFAERSANYGTPFTQQNKYPNFQQNTLTIVEHLVESDTDPATTIPGVTVAPNTVLGTLNFVAKASTGSFFVNVGDRLAQLGSNGVNLTVALADDTPEMADNPATPDVNEKTTTQPIPYQIPAPVSVVFGQATTFPAPVVFSPAGGTYTSAQTVTLTAEQGTTIYYTLNGLIPTVASTRYVTPITVATNTTIKAIAVDAAGNVSQVATAVYMIGIQSGDPANPNAFLSTIQSSAPVGQEFMVKVNLSNLINGISSAQMDVQFDNTVLEYIGLDDTHPNEYFTGNITSSDIATTNVNGKVSIAYAGQGTDAVEGKLVGLRFKGKKSGGTILTINNILLGDNTEPVSGEYPGVNVQGITINIANGFYYDVDGKDGPKAADATLILRYIVNKGGIADLYPNLSNSLSKQEKDSQGIQGFWYDVDGKDGPKAADATLILRYIVNKGGIADSYPNIPH